MRFIPKVSKKLPSQMIISRCFNPSSTTSARREVQEEPLSLVIRSTPPYLVSPYLPAKQMMPSLQYETSLVIRSTPPYLVMIAHAKEDLPEQFVPVMNTHFFHSKLTMRFSPLAALDVLQQPFGVKSRSNVFPCGFSQRHTGLFRGQTRCPQYHVWHPL